MTDFVHLHLHTEYSLLDGACRIEQLMDRLKELGQKACAITDHGVMYGAVDFYKAAKKAGIKPIIGCELYVAARTRNDRVYELDAEHYHLVLLCKNEQGYRNLIKLCSIGFTEGFYIKPRVDFETLSRYSEGLVCLSACLAGEVQQLLLRGNEQGARDCALRYDKLFGRGNYYLELQDHGIEEQEKINPMLVRLSRETNIPLVCTNDAHYLTADDADMHDTLLCIQTGKTLDEEDRMRFQGREFYVKSGDEMAQLFPFAPEAVTNTVRIAEMCDFDFEFGHYHLPAFQLPEGESDARSYMEKLCWTGFSQRYPAEPQEYKDRLRYELDMITRMGYVEYFLIVADFILFAKNRGIPVGPGRGSGAASIAAYCMRITDVDPMRYSLFFERFINPERVSMPDFDVDFCPNRRQEVIDYVTEKYGADHVAQIVTFGTMAARAAVRDVGRVMGMSYAEVDVVAKLVPQELKMTLDKALQVSPELKKFYEDDPRVHRLLDMARKLEGMPRNCSTHAAGVVITAQPVDHYVPLSKSDQGTVTQFGMTTLEELGLLKMDFLGLRNLTIIDDARKLIEAGGGKLDFEHLDYDDQNVFEMLGRGQTSGVFQLESNGMTGVSMSMKPRSVEDLTAIVALFRPGPMQYIPTFIACKNNPKNIAYEHPLLEPVLKVTYGCVVYQEQVMQIFRVLAGYSLGKADLVRRAMSKKKFDVLAAERESFVHGSAERGIKGCVANGVPEKAANRVFDQMLDFASYAFNKAHAVCYAVVAYQTAYLKYHYPKEYMAALLTSVLGQNGKVAEYIVQCRDMGVPVLPPDVNASAAGFTVSDAGIRFGLGSVKNVGVGLIEKMVGDRAENGRFQNFEDFCERMSRHDLNKRALESLIRCGAFDGMGLRRSALMAVYEDLLDSAAGDQKRNVEGQLDLFSEFTQPRQKTTALPDLPEFSKSELLSMERETCGLYLSGHPMDELRPLAERAGAVSVNRILSALEGEEDDPDITDGAYVTAAGVVSSVRTKLTKKQTNMAYATLEDMTGSLELMVFERALAGAGQYLNAEQAVLVWGRLTAREDEAPKLICDEVYPLEEGYVERYKSLRLAKERRRWDMPSSPRQESYEDALPLTEMQGGRTVFLRLPSVSSSEWERMAALLRGSDGYDKVVIRVADTGKLVSWTGTVGAGGALIDALEELLGKENVVVR